MHDDAKNTAINKKPIPTVNLERFIPDGNDDDGIVEEISVQQNDTYE